ncbi:hypothetical protein [Botrimarina hoheduenensis]|uniref:Uncharacterized protein n=1 Tax=Botrimarina hoheduenensis TaxID=2528000 RepID=A0A5C5WA72_9BACT|nr:hypothetical protein [Botrimarina hoheduenensis]TWT47776.1 hypothetical protein Pla111_13980 [Botrimarina hoheduenensis]
MYAPQPPSKQPDQVDCLLRNAELRNELEPLFDESIGSVDVARMTTDSENDFLASMLAWERAPMLPIAEWFDPPLRLPESDTLGDDEVRRRLSETVRLLYSKHVVLDFTDHLSDRELYTLIARDILPSYEKKLETRTSYLHWDCANTSDDPEIWLQYYATDEEREMWADEMGSEPPELAEPPHRRRLPRAPM